MTNSKYAWTGSVSSLSPAIRSSISSIKNSRILEDRRKYFKAQIENYTAEIKIYRGFLEINMTPSTATTIGVVLNFILTFTIVIFIFYIWIWIDLISAWYYLSNKPNNLTKKIVQAIDRRSSSGFQIDLTPRHFANRESIPISDEEISTEQSSFGSILSTNLASTRRSVDTPFQDENISYESPPPSDNRPPENNSMSFKCPNCGNECPPNDNFCQYCGRYLEK